MTRSFWQPLEIGPQCFPFLFTSGTHALADLDPATGGLVAEVVTSTPADVGAAVDAAAAAFRSASWRDSPRLRSRVLGGFAADLRSAVGRLSQLLTREQGKTIGEARSEVLGAADMVEYYAGMARAGYGRAMALSDSAHGVVLHEPVGVVAVITPWNWPLTLLMRSLAPALAAGNTCVVKPASLAPAVVVEALALLAAQPDLPSQAVTCVVGPGQLVGESLVAADGVDMVAFTGESTTGVAVMKAAASGLRKVALELGGKSPNIVFPDADLDKAVEGSLNASLTTAGQICTAGSRLLVSRSVYDSFVERLAERVRGLKLGDPLDPDVDLGPLVSSEQAEKVGRYVALGLEEGRLVGQSGPPEGDDLSSDCFVPPCIFDGLPEGSRLVQEEIFGPVLVAQAFEDEEEALSLAENTEFGLAAGIWTSDLDRAWRVGRALRAGTVWVNTYHHFYPEMEVGGFRRSGIGRQQGMAGLLEFTETKHLNFDSARSLW